MHCIMGSNAKRSKGQICIRGEKETDLLILTVTDDGVGMEEADPAGFAKRD